ncbi:Proteasome subunit alpha type-7 [Aduncisulcus paluster]|uniref:Proteasome subunit alpha type n=1 Tax=Aduncisulcus paluster TaxID=2918883 RepID=A0ABQ5K5G5_9EUKA|nr:Proteasome subunit alpha type-7 [Aduncisulcus paluster]
MSYDRALTVFSPDGRLFQVEYALQAVSKGNTCVALKGKDSVVIGVERKAAAKLQDPRTMKKIYSLDDGIALASAGWTADSRVIVDKARLECQTHRRNYEDAPTVIHVTRYVADLQQKFTQSGGVRPFGVSCLIAGFDPHGEEPRLFRTNPAGTWTGCYAAALGRSDKPVTEYLEKEYDIETPPEGDSAIKLIIGALEGVVEGGASSIDIAIMKKGQPVIFMKQSDIVGLAEELKREKEAEDMD